MNGIGAFFARESVPAYKDLMRYMINAYMDDKRKHHLDAIIVKKDNSDPVYIFDVDGDCYHDIETNYFEVFEKFYNDNMKIGDLIIFSFDGRIVYDETEKFILANNSSNVSCFNDWKKFADNYLYKLYIKNQRDMKRTLEDCDQCDINLIACDLKKMNLMSANDGHCGIQMCHAYIKGIGFMLHQNMVCLRNIIHSFTDCSQDAVNLWETWYGHPLEQEVIRETDLESGAMRKIKFNPKWSY